MNRYRLAYAAHTRNNVLPFDTSPEMIPHRSMPSSKTLTFLSMSPGTDLYFLCLHYGFWTSLQVLLCHPADYTSQPHFRRSTRDKARSQLGLHLFSALDALNHSIHPPLRAIPWLHLLWASGPPPLPCRLHAMTILRYACKKGGCYCDVPIQRQTLDLNETTCFALSTAGL